LVGKAEVRAEQRVVQEGSSPSGAQMRGAISKKRGSQPRWPEKVEGMERSKRASLTMPTLSSPFFLFFSPFFLSLSTLLHSLRRVVLIGFFCASTTTARS